MAALKRLPEAFRDIYYRETFIIEQRKQADFTQRKATPITVSESLRFDS